MKITIDIETEAGGDACFTTVAPESPTLGGPLVDLKQLRSVLDDMVVRAMRSYGAVPDETEEARPIDGVRLYGGVIDEVENFSESTRGTFSASQRDEGC